MLIFFLLQIKSQQVCLVFGKVNYFRISQSFLGFVVLACSFPSEYVFSACEVNFELCFVFLWRCPYHYVVLLIWISQITDLLCESSLKFLHQNVHLCFFLFWPFNRSYNANCALDSINKIIVSNAGL